MLTRHFYRSSLAALHERWSQSRASLHTVVLFALCASYLAPHAARAQEGPPPAPVVTARATEGLMAPITWYPGTVISRNDARLSAEVEGRLLEVAEVGTVVARGDPVARLDDIMIRQQLIENKAAVSREQTRLTFYEREVKRLDELARQNNVAQNELDQAISNRGVTRSELTAALARVELAQERLHRSVIRAPFSGVITERLMQAGEWAEGGDPIARLVNATALEVQTWVPVKSLGYVRAGSELKLKANPHESLASVRAIVPIGDDLSRMYELRLSLADASWPVGQTLRVGVPTAQPKRVVAVPRDALVLRRDGISVFRILDDGTAERVVVETGIAEGPLIEVSGVNPGDRVVIRGGERLRAGQKVVATEAATGASANE